MRRVIALGACGLSGLLLILGLPGNSAQAATFLWDGGGADNNWTTDANWNPDGAPVNDGTADIVFGGTLRTSPVTDVNYSIFSITFNSTAASFTNTGSQLTIGANGVTNNSTNAQTINNDIVLNAPLTFNAASGNLTFGGTIDNAGNLLTVDGAHNTTIGGAISGGGGLTKNGAGTLILSGTNTYTGPTLVNAGTLQGDTNSLPGNITNNANVDFSQTFGGTYAGVISGGGTVTKDGSGMVVFTGTNTYTGGTIVNAGTLQSGAAGAFVNNTAYTVNSGTLDLNNHDLTMSSLSGAGGTVSYGTAALGVNQSSNTTYSGVVTGSGAFTKSGTGTLILANNNTVSGTTTISGGTLQLGNGTATGSLGSGDIVDNSTLIFDSSGPQTESGHISGTGSVTQNGGGTTTLGATNTYMGGTTVNAGTLQAGVAGALVNSTAYTVNGGTLDLTTNGDITMSSLSGTGGTIQTGGHTLTVNNSASSQTYGGVITGTGNLDTQGTNTTLTLTGTNNYTGTTTIEAGSSLQIGNGGTSGQLGTGVVTINGTTTPLNLGDLIFDRSDDISVANNITGGGMLTQNGSDVLTLTGTNNYTGGTLVTVGTLRGSTASVQGNITDLGTVTFDQMGGAAGTYAGVLSGSGAVNISGTATDVTFTGTNTYSGTTTIGSGNFLRVGNGGATGSLGTGGVTDNGSLIFNTTANQTFAGAITGAGSLTQAGTNTLILSGTNAYTGGTTVSAGTLQGDTNSLQGAIHNSTTVDFSQAFDGTYAGIIDGTGVVKKDGAGNVTFSAVNTYTGNTTINAGTLTIDTSGSIASATTTVNSGGTLNVSGNVLHDVVNMGGTTTGTGTIAGNLTNNIGGTVTPGTAGVTGTTLTVNGTYTNASGSTVQIAVDSSGGNTTLHVNGTAMLNGGTVNVDTSNGFEVNHQYTFLTTGGLTEDFDSATTSAGNFIIATLGQSGNDEFVTLQSNFISAATTQNQRAVARYIDAIAGGATGDLETVISDLQGLTNAQAAAAFEQMSGDIHGTLGQLDVQGTTLTVQRIARHLRGGAFAPGGAPLVADDDGAPRPSQASPIVLVGCNDDGTPEFADASCDGCVHWTTWAQGFGLGGNAKSDGNAPGVAYNMGGTVAGIERWIDDCHLVGFYGGYTGINVPTSISHVSSVNSGHAGGYLMLDDGFSYYTLLGGFQFDGFNTNRLMDFTGTDQTASSDYSGWQTFWYLERGFTFQGCNRLFQPFFALQYDYLRQNSFTETGADAIDLAGSGVTTNSLRSIIGARVQQAIFSGNGRRLLPELHAMWVHEYLDTNTLVNATFTPVPTGSAGFTVQGLDFGRDWALLGTNLTWEMADGWSMFVSYDCQTNSQQTAHIGSGGLGYSW